MSLLEALRDLRGLDVGISRPRDDEGRRYWLLDATSGDGQVWRAMHADLWSAASLLTGMLTSAPLRTEINSADSV